MAWIELHQSLATHRKTLELADTLDVHVAQAIGHMACFWLWALDNAPDGDLTAVKPRTIARSAQWDGDPAAFVAALAAAGFVVDGRIHDWGDYTGRLIEKRRADIERKRQWRNSQRTTTNEGTPRGRHADATRNGARTVPNHSSAPSGAGASAAPTARPVRPVPKPQPERTALPKAVQEANRILHMTCDHTERELIVAAVPEGDQASLALWVTCLQEWRVRRHKPNIRGPLDWLQDGGPPPSRPVRPVARPTRDGAGLDSLTRFVARHGGQEQPDGQYDLRRGVQPTEPRLLPEAGSPPGATRLVG